MMRNMPSPILKKIGMENSGKILRLLVPCRIMMIGYQRKKKTFAVGIITLIKEISFLPKTTSKGCYFCSLFLF